MWVFKVFSIVDCRVKNSKLLNRKSIVRTIFNKFGISKSSSFVVFALEHGGYYGTQVVDLIIALNRTFLYYRELQ
jgi:hypothetical protein